MQESLFLSVKARIPDESKLIYSDPCSVSLPDREIRQLHYHDRVEIGICISGNGLWFVENKSYAISSGDIMIVPKGIPHYSRTMLTDGTSPCLCDFIYFDEHALLQQSGIDVSLVEKENAIVSPAVFTKHDHGELRHLLKKMITTVKEHPNEADQNMIAAHYYCIFRLMSNELPSPSPSQVEIKNERLLPAIRKMIVNFSEELTLDELAAECSYSASHFLKLFKKEYGISPMRYLNNIRAEVASGLLIKSDSTVLEISSAVGFSSSSDLYRHFKAIYGISPTDYRRKKSSVYRMGVQKPE